MVNNSDLVSCSDAQQQRRQVNFSLSQQVCCLETISAQASFTRLENEMLQREQHLSRKKKIKKRDVNSHITHKWKTKSELLDQGHGWIGLADSL